jgi:Mitochondrial carrier protein
MNDNTLNSIPLPEEYRCTPSSSPLEVVKLRLQCQPEKGYRIAVQIFKEEGFGAFYKWLL